MTVRLRPREVQILISIFVLRLNKRLTRCQQLELLSGQTESVLTAAVSSSSYVEQLP